MSQKSHKGVRNWKFKVKDMRAEFVEAA